MEQRRIAYDVLPLYKHLRQALQRDEGPPGARLALLRGYVRSVRQILMSGAGDAEDGGSTLYEAAVWHLLELFFLEPEASEGFVAEVGRWVIVLVAALQCFFAAARASGRPPSQQLQRVSKSQHADRPPASLTTRAPPTWFFARQLFAQWLRAHGGLLAGPSAPSLSERVDALRGSARLEAEPSYWPTLRRLLAVGQLEAVGGLLLAHPAYSADASGGAQVGGR